MIRGIDSPGIETGMIADEHIFYGGADEAYENYKNYPPGLESPFDLSDIGPVIDSSYLSEITEKLRLQKGRVLTFNEILEIIEDYSRDDNIIE